MWRSPFPYSDEVWLKLYSIPKGKRINTLDNFTALTSWGGVAQMTALSPDKLLLRRDTRGRESLYTLSFNGNSASGAIAVGDPILIVGSAIYIYSRWKGEICDGWGAVGD